MTSDMNFTSISNDPSNSATNVLNVVANATDLEVLNLPPVDQTTATDLFIIKAYKVITNGTLLNSSHICDAVSYFKRTQDSGDTVPSIHPQYAGSFAKISQMYNYLVSSRIFGGSMKSALQLFQRFQKILRELESNFGLSPYNIFFDKIRDNLFLIREDSDLINSISGDSVAGPSLDLGRYTQFWSMLTGYILEMYNSRTGYVTIQQREQEQEQQQQQPQEVTGFGVQRNKLHSNCSGSSNITGGKVEPRGSDADDLLMINDNILYDSTPRRKSQNTLVPQIPPIQDNGNSNGGHNIKGNVDGFNYIINDNNLFPALKVNPTGGYYTQPASPGSGNLSFGWPANGGDPLEGNSFGSGVDSLLLNDIKPHNSSAKIPLGNGCGRKGSPIVSTYGGVFRDLNANSKRERDQEANVLRVATSDRRSRQGLTYGCEELFSQKNISDRGISNTSSLPASSKVRTGLLLASKRGSFHERTKSMPSGRIDVNGEMVGREVQPLLSVKPPTVTEITAATAPPLQQTQGLVTPVSSLYPELLPTLEDLDNGQPGMVKADGGGFPAVTTTFAAYSAGLNAYFNVLSRQYEDLVREKDERIKLLQRELAMQQQEAVWLRKLLVEDMGYIRNVLHDHS